ncbi:MAG: hypothetical protein LC122_12095 [Chitinophagales bacterium]|nr:hypothetical protein [Chitinophagales bacterium]
MNIIIPTAHNNLDFFAINKCLFCSERLSLESTLYFVNAKQILSCDCMNLKIVPRLFIRFRYKDKDFYVSDKIQLFSGEEDSVEWWDVTNKSLRLIVGLHNLDGKRIIKIIDNLEELG